MIGERTHFMLDLETMSKRPDAAIVSIGACRFDPTAQGDPVRETFYTNVDLVSCAALGLHVDADTVVWWLKQSAEARGRLTASKGSLLAVALQQLDEWMVRAASGAGAGNWEDFADDGVALWANGPAFDCAIVRNAHQVAMGRPFPLPFWMDRDCRTVMDLLPHRDAIDIKVQCGTALKHDALEDAKGQARYVTEALRRLKLV